LKCVFCTLFFCDCPVNKNVHTAHVLTILDSLFAPLARLLVARGVLFSDFAERMRAHYVAAAEAQGEGKATDSRLSLLTGLQRREVTRLRGFVPRDERPNHLARLVALWQTDPAWAPEGTPLPLPRNGPAPSFEALAWSVRRDVHPRTMLDALTASGTVALTEDGSVQLLRGSYQPLAGSEDQLAYLARNLGDHLATATDNVLGRTPPQFERAVHYGGLTEAQVAELEAAHAEGQMALFQNLSRRAAAMKAAGPGGDSRFRAGAYFHQSKDEQP
jgi:hypothetical protein